MTQKRQTKGQIREEARIRWLAENASDRRVNGWTEGQINLAAEWYAQHVADEARPTSKQRTERREREEREARAKEKAWRARAAGGEPPEGPTIEAGTVPPRNVIQDSDGFIPVAIVDGKQHKLGKVPSEATARRIADVARHALAIIYSKPKDNPLFPGEFAASACITANYALGFGRDRGRPQKSAGRANYQVTKVRPITSGEVVDRIAELVRPNFALF